jgi:hypothetical protein
MNIALIMEKTLTLLWQRGSRKGVTQKHDKGKAAIHGTLTCLPKLAYFPTPPSILVEHFVGGFNALERVDEGRQFAGQPVVGFGDWVPHLGCDRGTTVKDGLDFGMPGQQMRTARRVAGRSHERLPGVGLRDHVHWHQKQCGLVCHTQSEQKAEPKSQSDLTGEKVIYD